MICYNCEHFTTRDLGMGGCIYSCDINKFEAFNIDIDNFNLPKECSFQDPIFL